MQITHTWPAHITCTTHLHHSLLLRLLRFFLLFQLSHPFHGGDLTVMHPSQSLDCAAPKLPLKWESVGVSSSIWPGDLSPGYLDLELFGLDMAT